MIKPAVSRKVWYWPFPHERAFESTQPFDATICYVLGDSAIHAAINNEFGNPLPGKPCTLAQDRDAVPGECSWMPFQVGQARQQTDSATAVHVVGTGPIAGELAGG